MLGLAHPAFGHDDPDEPDEIVQGIVVHLDIPGVDCSLHPEQCDFVVTETTPEWKACHDSYWPCVDEARFVQGSYNHCIGAENQLSSLLKKPVLRENGAIRNYPFPIHPIEGLKANDLAHCLAHLQACRDTVAIWRAETGLCEGLRLVREKALKRKLRRLQ
jgi:hypothetical protein